MEFLLWTGEAAAFRGSPHVFGGTAIESNIKTAIDLRNPEDKGLGGLQSGTADDIRKPLRV
jgi:hypothetical protein